MEKVKRNSINQKQNDLNIRKMTNHPPSPVLTMMYPNPLHFVDPAPPHDYVISHSNINVFIF